MKKRIVIVSALLCLALAGCNSSSKETETTSETTAETSATTESTAETPESETETEDPTPVVDTTVEKEGIDKFVTLGEYKGLDLTKTVTSVTDEEVESKVASDLVNGAEEVKDGTVEDGDIANIDYEGKIDGTAFDGGTAEGYDLTIGSGSFIDDFEDQLVGAKTGETKEITVTFPEDYGNEELNGKDAVFTVKINSIKRAPKEISDEWVAANSSFKTVDEYKANVKSELEKSYEASALSAMQNEAFGQVYNSSTFLQYPQEMVDEYSELMKQTYENYASYYGMEYDEFISSSGMTDITMANAAKSNVKTALIVDAICEKEGIDTEGDVYKDRLTQTLQENGYDTMDAAVEAGIAETDVQRTVKYYCALDAIISYANVTENKETETQTEAVSETSAESESESESAAE